MKSLRAAFFAVLFSFGLAAVPAFADTTGLVRGLVTIGGKPAAGVALTLSGEGNTLHATTDASGAYQFSRVPFGSYTLKATANGVPAYTEPVSVETDSVATISFDMQLKEIARAQTAFVRGPGSAPVSVNSITSQQLAALPENQSLENVIETLPGIVHFSYNEPVAHGFHGISYEIDGVPLDQATASNFAEIIDPREIDSLEVFTGAFPAEFGGTRQGAVVNIISKRVNDFTEPENGTFTVGAGSYGDLQSTLTENLHLGGTEVFFSADQDRTNRGVDSPTFVPVHDNSNLGDEFLRTITNVGARDTLSFDASNSTALFQIPINDTPNPNDPIVVPSSTDDVQREYRRFFNLVYTANSKDGNSFTQIAPWTEYDRIAYAGDVVADLAGMTPALEQDRHSTFEGLRLTNFHLYGANAVKLGFDGDIENFAGSETIYYNTNASGASIPTQVFSNGQAKNGSNVGAYVEDKWSPTKYFSAQGGLRYDESSGYTHGSQLSPRIELNGQVDPQDVLHFYYGRLYAAPFLEDTRAAAAVLSGETSISYPYSLQPEHDQYYEFGLEHALTPTTRSTLNFWKRDVLDVLDTSQLLNTPIFGVYNSAIGIAEGVEGRVDSRFKSGDSLYFSASLSKSNAGGVSGGQFLFCPTLQPTCLSSMGVTSNTLSPEDHDQTFASEFGYTKVFGGGANDYFATLEPEYGTGYPIEFNSGATGRLPPHLIWNGSIGRKAGHDKRKTPGFDLTVTNFTNDRYLLKVENGFNTTQWGQGFKADLRLTMPF
jgi:outer membrane receptor protein involved in Fe transport